MNQLMIETKDLLAEALEAESPIAVIRPAVAGMSREDIESLAIAYLLNQIRTRPGRIRADTSPGGFVPTPEMVAARQRIAERIESDAEASRATFKQNMDRAFASLKEGWRIVWTQEMLAAEVHLAEGVTVKFGDATREQHIDRAAAHRKNTLRNMEAAVRHEKAIETLNSSGAKTLRAALTE